MNWRRPDLAARVVIAHRGAWSGSDWHILPAIAETLEAEHGRKSGFWGLVEGRVTREPEVTFNGRRPLWRES